MIKIICQLIPVNIIQDKTLDRKDMNPLERIIAASMSFTGSYADIDLKFETGNLKTLNVQGSDKVTLKSLQQMLEYFIGSII